MYGCNLILRLPHFEAMLDLYVRKTESFFGDVGPDGR
jgi:hypothetical protein